MNLQELLLELRRNPETNVKMEGDEGAVNFLKNKGKDMRNYGVSMTDLPKLGINPSSRYNTPVGIYFYPADYYVRMKDVSTQGYGAKPGKLDFKDDAPYIQIFELTGNIEDVSRMTESVYGAYIKKLFQNVSKISTLINKSEKETTDLLSRCILEARTEAKNSSYGGYLWYILYSLGFYAGRDKRDNMPPRSSVVWNHILRLIGIDGLIDEGEGIIHDNEKYQGVILDPRSIKHVNTFKNAVSEDKDKSAIVLNHNAASPITYHYLDNLADDIIDNDLHYDVKYRKACKMIMDKVLNILHSSPSSYNTLGKHRIYSLLKLTADRSIKQEIVVGYWSEKFPRLKAELDEMVKDWEEEKADPAWATKPEIRKNRAFAFNVPPEKVRYAREVLVDLNIYKSNPDAKKMIDYIEACLSKFK